MRLLSRKPRTVKIVSGWDPTAGLFISRELPRATAESLYKAMKLQRLDIGRSFGTCYGPRRSWRNMLHNQWPPHHPDVLAALETYEQGKAQQ